MEPLELSPLDAWMDIGVCICARQGSLQPEIRIRLTTCSNISELEDIMLSEISQAEKKTVCSHSVEAKKADFIDVEGRMVVTRGWKQKGVGEMEVDSSTKLHLDRRSNYWGFTAQ